MRRFLFIIILFNSLIACSQQVEQNKIPSDSKTFDIPIFAYHRFGDNRYPSTNISLEVFEEQLRYLKDKQYTVLTFGEAVKRWKNGDAFPQKSVVITIDDGYLSFFENGVPLLKKYGFKASVFVQTAVVADKDFMSWQQLTELKKEGFEIGNHSDSHDFFVNFKDGEREMHFAKDLEKSTDLILKNLGEKPVLFVYPYGEWTNDMEQILKEHGYTAAAVQKSGVFCELSNPFEIPRFPMGGMFGTIDGFKNKIILKALHVVKTIPESPFLNDNPPELRVEVLPGEVNLSRAQFFVAGTKSDNIKIIEDPNHPAVILRAPAKLTARRTLYTITAPSADGKTWHWFSYLWIRPEVGE